MTVPDEAYRQARALIAQRFGLHFPESRRADLQRALAGTARAAMRATPLHYLARLASLPDDAAEWAQLATRLTVSETSFFRDAACFDALAHEVLPALIVRRRTQGMLWLRLWSAGCASGEEPYSLAILLDRLLPDRAAWAISILATDINPAALDVARRGVYRSWSLRDVPAELHRRYFHDHGNGTCGLDARIRRMVTFARFNLLSEKTADAVPHRGTMDLILCRNVLMYFTPAARPRAIARLERTLGPEGWLAVAAVEASEEFGRPFTAVNFPGAVFYRKVPAGQSGLPSPRDSRQWSELPASGTVDPPGLAAKG